MSDLLNFSDFGCMKWKVPNKIFKSDENTKASFIRGLYEGDGTRLQKVKGDCYFIAFSMKNRKGLDQLRRLLNGLGISTRYWKDYTNDLERLVVYGAEDVIRFKNVIKPKFKEIVLSGALLAEIAEKSASKAE